MSVNPSSSDDDDDSFNPRKIIAGIIATGLSTVIVEIVGIKTPKDGDYVGTITLSGDAEASSSVPFTTSK